MVRDRGLSRTLDGTSVTGYYYVAGVGERVTRSVVPYLHTSVSLVQGGVFVTRGIRTRTVGTHRYWARVGAVSVWETRVRQIVGM